VKDEVNITVTLPRGVWESLKAAAKQAGKNPLVYISEQVQQLHTAPVPPRHENLYGCLVDWWVNRVKQDPAVLEGIRRRAEAIPGMNFEQRFLQAIRWMVDTGVI
jgi:hypothetical protein